MFHNNLFLVVPRHPQVILESRKGAKRALLTSDGLVYRPA